jgi:FMN reductase
VVVVGNPKPESRTWALARATTAALLDALGAAAPAGPGGTVGAAPVIDLGGLTADPLGRGPAWAAALEQARAARLLVVASPTYKGAYTGLLKLFADDLPPQALAGAVAVGLITAASPTHLPAGEAHLRPLLLELGASVPAPVLAVAEADLPDPRPVLAGWLRTAAPAIAGALAATHRPDGTDRQPAPA